MRIRRKATRKTVKELNLIPEKIQTPKLFTYALDQNSAENHSFRLCWDQPYLVK